MSTDVKPSNLNLPNALTLGRIVIVPLFAWLLWQGHGQSVGYRMGALAVFLAAIFTDRLDGQIARSRNLVTDFGKIADPIADKALIGTALVELSLLGMLWWWVTVVIIVREAAITILRFLVIRRGVIAASKGGKLKTVLQASAVGLYVAPFELYLGPLGAWPAHLVMAAALVVTVVTGIDYLRQALRLPRNSV